MKSAVLFLSLLGAAASCWATEPTATVSLTAQPVPAPTTTACSLDTMRAVARASQLGYRFITKESNDNSFCSIEPNGQILVVSASSRGEARCQFELFVPPTNKQQPLLRLLLKDTDGHLKYVQRNSNMQQGLSTELRAPKGQTRQFRLMHVELTPVDGKCEDNRLESRL